ncbi:PP2C family serine/threonine-protein phosphatase [Antrihabitans sp. YC2-6]|uniref:PP2C family protein-serine/threonine phosphatase n=1 Tax=Antrihabitans sp. YC2-6 TaxID=2799498 RepID=UPI0018F295D4|nr:protein phosphatase 2C domain-containing protein [Antrihabitans sp. YC2-6]MBJ8348530.1 serine/threonine-protein phosphatase [Antrihabitans sp. YC2-6]
MTFNTVIAGATLNWGAASDVGSVRETNQDSYCDQPPVYVVADGMGGQSAGDAASREAIAAMATLAGKVPVTGKMLRSCFADARDRIGRIRIDGGRPPGTTLTGVIVTEENGMPYWMVVNIGDSRTYRLDANGFGQITKDHSAVQELIDSEEIDVSTANFHPIRNIVTRALLADTPYDADLWELPMVAGDRILVCSDGLTREVDDPTLVEVLTAIADPQAAADELIRLAIQNGGHDNITVLVVDAVQAGEPVPETRPTPVVRA